MSTTRRELEARLVVLAAEIEERMKEVELFKGDLREEEQLFKLLQDYHDDVQAHGALEVIELADEALKLILGELVDFIKERHLLKAELKKLENQLPQ